MNIVYICIYEVKENRIERTNEPQPLSPFSINRGTMARIYSTMPLDDNERELS